jgi:S-adenosylmethionine:tRNA ribosyltransferase-isomerase
MEVDLFDFELPEELIAQTPLADRSASRLMVIERGNHRITHRTFRDILSYFRPGDVLVLNDTKVLPARLYGIKEGTGARIEVLLLKQLKGKKDVWETLVRPGKRIKAGTSLIFGDGRLKAVCEGETEVGGRILRFHYQGVFQEILSQLGEMPLPPYIHEKLAEKDRYQTVYARHEGSAAAPTAGLHFTEEILEAIKAMGVQIAYVTLHVGLGTFRPVTAERVEEHRMHSEYYEINEENAALIRECKQRGSRLIAVGTTACRTLETVASEHEGEIVAARGWTDIFIYPGYSFKAIDGLLTNFHLPRSSLIMLVSAFAGRELIMEAYQQAIAERYRFFSFGDAMLII